MEILYSPRFLTIYCLQLRGVLASFFGFAGLNRMTLLLTTVYFPLDG
jgi:hypothetical protein